MKMDEDRVLMSAWQGDQGSDTKFTGTSLCLVFVLNVCFLLPQPCFTFLCMRKCNVIEVLRVTVIKRIAHTVHRR